MTDETAEGHEVSLLLRRMREGDASASDELLRVLYTDLHGRARRAMGGDHAMHTLQPTALVGEVWLKIGAGVTSFADRDHFLATASSAMRQVLVDHARAKGRNKRTAGGHRVELDTLVREMEDRSGDLEALDRALVELAEFNPTMARVVEMRFFGGVGMGEIARSVGMATRTLERKWRSTRAWLAARIR